MYHACCVAENAHKYILRQHAANQPAFGTSRSIAFHPHRPHRSLAKKVKSSWTLSSQRSSSHDHSIEKYRAQNQIIFAHQRKYIYFTKYETSTAARMHALNICKRLSRNLIISRIIWRVYLCVSSDWHTPRVHINMIIYYYMRLASSAIPEGVGWMLSFSDLWNQKYLPVHTKNILPQNIRVVNLEYKKKDFN